MWAWEDLWFAIVKWTVLLIQIRAGLLVYLWILDVPHWFLSVHLIYCLWCSVFKVTLIFLFFSFRTGTFIIMQFSVLTLSISLTYFSFLTSFLMNTVERFQLRRDWCSDIFIPFLWSTWMLCGTLFPAGSISLSPILSFLFNSSTDLQLVPATVRTVIH